LLTIKILQTMKKTLFLSAVIGMAALFVSCNGDDNNPVKLDVSTTTINVDAAQTTETFDITTTAKWNITAPDSWVSAAPANGNGNATITITVQANEATTPRSTNIKVTAEDQVKEITINQAAKPAAPGKATITGKDSNCPEGTPTVTLTAEAANATSYVWYNGASVIDGATTATFAVASSGTYYVVGVNAGGEGEKSASHEVTIYPDCNGGAFIDELVGTWNVVEGIYDGETEYYPIQSEIQITKIDGNTISISGIWSQMFNGWPGFSLTATVNSTNETITVTGTKIIDGLLIDGYDTYFVPKLMEMGVDLTTVTQTYPVQRVDGSLVITPLDDYDDPQSNTSFAIAATEAGSTSNLGWVFISYLVEWTKGAAAPAPKAVNQKLNIKNFPKAKGELRTK
jgi:hypothetical protein